MKYVLYLFYFQGVYYKVCKMSCMRSIFFFFQNCVNRYPQPVQNFDRRFSAYGSKLIVINILTAECRQSEETGMKYKAPEFLCYTPRTTRRDSRQTSFKIVKRNRYIYLVNKLTIIIIIIIKYNIFPANGQVVEAYSNKKIK